MASRVEAVVVINEFSSGTTSDWVELFNNGAEPVDLTGYRLRDSTTSNKKDLSGSLGPGGWLSFGFSNYLNNSGDVVKLVQIVGESETGIDEVSYGEESDICAPAAAEAVGRKPDGVGSFVRLAAATRDAANVADELPCATPTPSPTPTATPTQT